MVMVILGAPINFILLQRFPKGHEWRNGQSLRSILSLDLALLVAFGLPCALFGARPIFGTYLPVMIIASWIGNWLFFVQHQFEEAHWERDSDWDFHVAALSGSSYFKLPPVLRWFSGNVGLHHVHHLCSRVPNYRLQACLDAAPELQEVAKVITLRESLGCWRLALWDERRHLLVGFRDLEPQLGQGMPVARAAMSAFHPLRTLERSVTTSKCVRSRLLRFCSQWALARRSSRSTAPKWTYRARTAALSRIAPKENQ